MSLIRDINVNDGDGNNITSTASALDVQVKNTSLPVDISDGSSNPLSSYYNAATDNYVLNVHDADVHNQPVNQYFHQHTGINTTLTTATLANGSTYIIDVVSTTGFTVGGYIQVGADNHTGVKYQIIALTATTMTLDSYVDIAFPISTVISEVDIQMNKIGTLASPQEYIIKPSVGQIIHITRIIITMTHTSLGDDGLFGDLPALTNGFLIRANIGGQYGTFTNWKTNEKIAADMYDLRYTTRTSGGGTYGTVGRGSFYKLGVVVRLDGDAGDFMEVYNRDDLTGLLSFEIKAQGHVEGA